MYAERRQIEKANNLKLVLVSQSPFVIYILFENEPSLHLI